ncbi:hypothetical protein HERIO_993 [Hepatospora eriocheir]|uniref:Uncharacterized protein n=1 Tax=Hepatospora eriocheir TaxID=1081669 RepID=A0A1X0QBH9_9MICR|nr:hypothetical protein HERIO_993 [Hepatospora eriocheir]
MNEIQQPMIVHLFDDKVFMKTYLNQYVLLIKYNYMVCLRRICSSIYLFLSNNVTIFDSKRVETIIQEHVKKHPILKYYYDMFVFDEIIKSGHCISELEVVLERIFE